MKSTLQFFIMVAALTALIGCGGSSEPSNGAKDAAPAPANEQSSQSAATGANGGESAGARDDTADAAVATYVNGVRDGKLEEAISVLVPDAPGTERLISMKEGWDRAAAEGAPIGAALAMIAGEIDALTYEKVSDDGAFATFRFTKPTSDQPWEIQAIKTPEGWRVTPPPTGLPQN